MTREDAGNIVSTAGDCPWLDIDEAGTGLTVDNFLTTMLSQLANLLRRTVTLPYAEQLALTVPEWRLLALLAYKGPLPFSMLVAQSTTDKALVSRTLHRLERRGLVRLDEDASLPRKRLTCSITTAGMAVHDRLMPVVRRKQAAVIRVLDPQERRALYGALRKLRARCLAGAIAPARKTQAGGR